MASDTVDRAETASGLTPNEAQEFHKAFVMSFIGFTLIAIVAHILVWTWRPWVPPSDGNYDPIAMMDGVTTALTSLTALV